MKPHRFSAEYGITRDARDDWFDPLLNEDTALAVDPFLIFFESSGRWRQAHPKLMAFFNYTMELLADSGFKVGAPKFVKAKNLLLFKEPPEFCLGVSQGSIFGAGSATGLQQGMLLGAATAIRLGLDELKHFEELALFGGQIAADRIGDITCDVIKDEFISYTQAVAKRHNVPLVQVNVGTAGWDPTKKMWKPGLVELPVNPVASAMKGHPVGVILTPRRFLRQMPSVDPNEFWDYAVTSEGEQLRNEFNVQIGQSIDREKVAKLAERRRALLTRYLEKLEAEPKDPYDVDEDPKLIVRRRDFDRLVADSLEATEPTYQHEFVGFVEGLLTNFKQCVEERGAWRLLWVNDKPRSEKHVQLLFQTSAVLACQQRDVDVSPESNAGRGPVDFKVARGWKLRALVEVKLAKSGSFKRNLENQTSAYASAEGCDRGYFLVVQFDEADKDAEFVKKAEAMASKISAKAKIAFKIVWVDATPKRSASTV